METGANYSLVGGFVLFLSLLLVAAILWLANIGEANNSKYYTVYFRKHSLSGLQKDSYVLMKGIKVGSVDQYQIAKDNIESVKVTLLIDKSAPVKTDSKAIVSRNILTGLATIELVGSTQDSPALKESPPGEDYPVIPEGSSTLDKITDSIPSLIQQMSEMTDRFEKLMSEQNLAAVTNSLTNIEQLTKGLNENQAQFDKTLKSANSVAENLAKISSDLSAFTKNTDRRFSSLSDEGINTLKQVQSSFKELETQIANVSKSMTNTSHVFSSEMVAIAHSISEAADSFAKTVEQFDDPRRIISGPGKKSLGPGEVLPK